MNNKISKYLKIVAILLFGVVLGIGSTLWWASSTFEAGREMAALLNVTQNLEEADYLYKNAPPEIVIYKLNRALSQIESYEKLEILYLPDKLMTNWDKALLNGRIGRLYEKTGKTKEASLYFSNAQAYFAKTGWKLKDETEVSKAIAMLDTMKRSEVIKSIGEYKNQIIKNSPNKWLDQMANSLRGFRKGGCRHWSASSLARII